MLEHFFFFFFQNPYVPKKKKICFQEHKFSFWTAITFSMQSKTDRRCPAFRTLFWSSLAGLLQTQKLVAASRAVAFQQMIQSVLH